MSADIIPFGRMVECVACGRRYRAAIRPTNHPLLQERRASMCHNCNCCGGGSEIMPIVAAQSPPCETLREQP